MAQILTDAPLTVYADGLMSYGPTRSKLAPLVGTRVERLLHLDLVPGLTPLLTEFGVAPEIVPTPAFTKVLASLADTGAGLPDVAGPAVLLGQYLSALGILSAEGEERLHVRMLTGAAALGHTRVVFQGPSHGPGPRHPGPEGGGGTARRRAWTASTDTTRAVSVACFGSCVVCRSGRWTSPCG